MYVSEGGSGVTAFDVVSGDVAWLHQRRYPEDIGPAGPHHRVRPRSRRCPRTGPPGSTTHPGRLPEPGPDTNEILFVFALP